jgi:hypothetical protein
MRGTEGIPLPTLSIVAQVVWTITDLRLSDKRTLRVFASVKPGRLDENDWLVFTTPKLDLALSQLEHEAVVGRVSRLILKGGRPDNSHAFHLHITSGRKLQAGRSFEIADQSQNSSSYADD